MDKDTVIRVKNCRLVVLPTVTDERGSLTFGEKRDWPFEVQRVFWTYGMKPGAQRSNHAHHTSQEVLFPIGGGWTIELDDGHEKQTLRMDDPGVGIYTPPMVWTRISDFDEGAACISLASDLYNAADYIHSYDEFLSLTRA